MYVCMYVRMYVNIVYIHIQYTYMYKLCMLYIYIYTALPRPAPHDAALDIRSPGWYGRRKVWRKLQPARFRQGNPRRLTRDNEWL